MILPGSEINYLVAALVQFVEKLDHASLVSCEPYSGENVTLKGKLFGLNPD